MEKRGWSAHQASNLTLARAYVKQYAPYLVPTLYGLVPSPQEGLTQLAGGPMAVSDRLVLLYDPEWVESVSVKVLATGLAHECMHPLLKHAARGKSYPNKERWNWAGDLFINSTMRTQKKKVRAQTQAAHMGQGTVVEEDLWEFPEWALMPEQFDLKPGLTADEYYHLLEGKAGDGGGKSKGDSKIMCGTCGGAAGNPLSREIELKHDNAKGRSEANCKSIVRETAKAIKQAMNQGAGAGRGTIPGSWSELVEISDTVFAVPWRKEFANVFRFAVSNMRTGGMDYSKRRPSKRSYLRGIQLPSLISYDPTVFIIVDSSGSMGNQQLGDALRVSSDILQQTGIPNAWFMEADTHGRRAPVKVSARDLVSLTLNGRGGTDFRPAIEFVDRFRPRPHIVLYITDGDGTAPNEPVANMNFIWCIVPSPFRRIMPTWGRVIVLDDETSSPIEEGDDDIDD